MLEVLAPVGNIKALKAAIYAGADAVYLGLDLFNARIKADNFNKDNIAEWINYCHLFGVKVYITFNTNIKESETKTFAQYVDICAKAKADAFIVTDLGCLDILKKYDIPLHGSTQIGVHNLAGAKVLEELGFTRVVVARETLSSDIAQIRKNTRLEIEHFVHGALCVSFSGACLMSSMMSGDSGNRGRCNQPCRLKYSSSFSSKESYLLSPKDQCLIDKISELAKLGVDSLKIEGRLKQPHYVGETVKQYRLAVDGLIGGKQNKFDYESLKTAYNRGDFTQGYNYQSSKDIIYDKVNGNIGLEVGKIINSSHGKAIASLNRELRIGDGIKILHNGKELGGLAVTGLRKIGDNYQIDGLEKFPIGSAIRLTSDIAQINRYTDVCPKISIKLFFQAKRGEKIKLKAIYRDIEVIAEGEAPQESIAHCATYESLAKQLLRLGESNYSATLSVDIEEGLFIPVSSLNSLRREVIEKLSCKILSYYDNNKQRVEYSKALNCYYNRDVDIDKSKLFVEIAPNDDLESIIKVIDKNVNLVLNFNRDLAQYLDIVLNNALFKNNTAKIFLKLPRVARGKDYTVIEEILEKNKGKFDGIVADNLYGVYLAKKFGVAIVGGLGLNIYNKNYASIVGLNHFINSAELTYEESVGGMTFAFGRLAIMTLLHCPVQVNTGCTCNDCRYNGEFKYFDRRGSYDIERTKIEFCQFSLYNQQIIDIRKKISKIKSNLYLNLSGFKASDIAAIIDDFDKKCGASVDNSTCGHLFRGVK